jgi:twinkle protein
MANQLFIAKSVVDGWKWAVFCPENYPATTYYNGLIMSFIGKEIHPKNEAYKMKPQEYEAGMNFINDHFYFIYPDELHDIETIHEKFKYLILKKGVHGVIIDPLNQLDKTQKAFQRDDQYLSDLYMNIKRFALSHQVCYNVIAHPNSPREKNPLPVPTAYDLWGGAMNFNKADNILCIHRENLQEPFTQVHIQKNKVVDTGGSLAGTHFVGRYLWQEKRFYFQEQNPITDYWAERTKRENGEYSSEFKFTEYNNDPENEIPPF